MTTAPLTRRRLLATSALSTVALLAGPARAHKAGDVAADLRMAGDAGPYRQTAEQFVARAMAGDLAATQGMISQQMQERIGVAAVRRALELQIVPFFAQGSQIGKSVTITRTTDAVGQTGFAFYMWMLQRNGGEQRPFTVYVVEEQARRVVANVVPDRLVPGRHA